MPSLIESAYSVGADSLRLKLAECWDQEGRTHAVPFSEIISSPEFYETVKCAKARRIPLQVSAEIDEHDYKQIFQHPKYKCESPWYEYNILHNGDVVPCLMGKRLQRNYICGNIFHEPFEAIWNGEQFRSLRRQLLRGDPPEFCRFCSRTVYKG